MKLAGTIMLLIATLSVSADEFSRWTWRVPDPPAALFSKVVYAQDQFVAVGDLGYIMTSTNGLKWNLEVSPTTNQLRSVIYTDQFVASGDKGTIITSPDARTWQLTTAGDSQIEALAYGNDIYMALDSRGNLFRSNDARQWIPVGDPINKGGRDMTFGSGLFVTVGLNGLIATSTNGVNWVQRTSGTTGILFSVAYGDGLFVAVGAEGTQGVILTSNDGIYWQLQFVDKPLSDVTFNDGEFLIIGGSFMGSGTSLTSSDGIYFNEPASDPGLDWSLTGVTCGGGACVAVGAGMFISYDGGQTWSDITVGPRAPIYGYAQKNSTLVGVGGSGVIVTTTNGVDFTNQQILSDKAWLSVCAGEPGFAAVGVGGRIAFSPDGFDWTNITGATLGELPAIAFGGGIYVAVAWEAVGKPYGYFVTSTNGLDWVERRPFVDTYINRTITYGAGQFVAGGYDGKIYTSTNGIDWTERLTGVGGNTIPVAYLNNGFIASTGGGILHSTDGLTWTFTGGETPNARAMAYGNGLYVAVTGAWPDVLWSSPDGITWKREKFGARDLSAVTYAFDSFYISGAVIQSQSSLIPTLEHVTQGNEQLDASVFGEIGRDYELQSSTDLKTWQHESDYNQGQRIQPLTLPTGPSQKFYRVKLKQP
ncbi:hypothetical protein GC207_00750 [bacterium]|nr:hypothetical protein [bacterium]